MSHSVLCKIRPQPRNDCSDDTIPASDVLVVHRRVSFHTFLSGASVLLGWPSTYLSIRACLGGRGVVGGRETGYGRSHKDLPRLRKQDSLLYSPRVWILGTALSLDVLTSEMPVWASDRWSLALLCSEVILADSHSCNVLFRGLAWSLGLNSDVGLP